MSKLTNETKQMLRRIAKRLPVYVENHNQVKHIHEKDIESRGMVKPKDYDKNKQYQASFKDGERLVDEKLHFKRLCSAWKKGGSKKYRKYLTKFSQNEFRELNWWEKLINYIFKG